MVPSAVGLEVRSAPPKDREAKGVDYLPNVNNGAFFLSDELSKIVRPLIRRLGSFGLYKSESSGAGKRKILKINHNIINKKGKGKSRDHLP